MFKSIYKWFSRMFRSNKMLLQLTIQALAGEFFKKHPRFKPVVGKILNDTVMTIMGDAMSMAEAKNAVHDRIKALGSNPAEKALMTALIDSLFAELERYFNQEKILGLSAQTQVVVQAFRWIVEASEF